MSDTKITFEKVTPCQNRTYPYFGMGVFDPRCIVLFLGPDYGVRLEPNEGIGTINEVSYERIPGKVTIEVPY